MSQEILEAFRKNGEKFKTIKAKSVKIGEMIDEKRKLMFEMSKIYGLVFRNFSSSRQNTGIMVETENHYGRNDKEEIILTKDGIFMKGQNQFRADGIINNIKSFFHYITEIEKHEAEILPLLNEKKRDIFVNYIRICKGIKYEFEYTYELPELKKLIEYDDGQRSFDDDKTEHKETYFKIKKIIAKDDSSQIIKLDDRQDSDESESWRYRSGKDINVESQSHSDKIIIEQIYDELLAFYDNYEQAQNEMIVRYQEAVKKLNEVFYAYLMLGKIKTQGKTE